jgi:hypothetical protein
MIFKYNKPAVFADANALLVAAEKGDNKAVANSLKLGVDPNECSGMVSRCRDGDGDGNMFCYEALLCTLYSL